MSDNINNDDNKKLVKLHTLNKGDCFIFNGLPYKIEKVSAEDIGSSGLKSEIYVCKMKFENNEFKKWFTTGDIEVYKISRNLFNMLVPDNVEKCREQWIRILSL